MKSTFLFSFVFFIALSKGVLSQVSYRQYSTEHGIPGPDIYDIIQDRKGYLWLATNRGLCRFDGYEFKTFTIQDGLTDNLIFKIIEDQQNRLYLTTMAGGICYYENGKIQPYSSNNKIKDKLTNKYVNSYFVDSRDNILFSTENDTKTIYKIPHSRSRQTLLKDTFQGNSDYHICLKHIENKKFIFSSTIEMSETAGTPAIKKIKDDFVIRFSEFPQIKKINYLRLSDGTYISTCNKELLHFSDSGILLNTIKFPSVVINIYQDLDKNVWISTTEGVLFFSHGDINSKPAHFFKRSYITKVIRDHEGNYWVSTLAEGVCIIAAYDIHTITSHELKDEKINNLTTRAGQVYFSTYKGYLYKISDNQTPVEIPYARQYLADIHFAGDGFLWLANGKKISGKKILPFQYGDCDLPNAKVLSETRKGEILVGTGMGFYKLNNKRCLVQSYKLGFNKRITAIYETRNGNIWIGTHDGLYRYSEGLIRFMGEENAFFKSLVTDISENSNGTLFIGTSGFGLVVMNSNGSFSVNTRKGLTSDMVEKITLQNDSCIWVATFKGLNKIYFDRQLTTVKSISHYTTANGLPSNEVNDVVLANNYVWIATAKGLAYFNPALTHSNQYHLPLYITALLVNNQSTDLQSTYHLKYNQGNIVISFIGISYRSSANVNYKYRLLGTQNDTAWKYTPDRNIQYTNLPAGEHVFQLVAINDEGAESGEPVNLFFKIDKHFAETWWFFFLVSLVLISLVAIGIRLYIHNHKRKIEIANTIVKSEQKALLSQMSPHFIFNAINSVTAFIMNNEKRPAVIYLSKFSTLIRKILDNSKYTLISLEEELVGIQLYLELEKLRFNDGFEFCIIVDDKIHPSEVNLPSMLIQPFLENAIWHGIMPKSGNGKLVIEFSAKDDDEFICRIEDNGIGRAKAAELNIKRKNHRSVALQNIRERLYLLNQLYKTDIILQIEDVIDELGEISGTRVLITLPRFI